MLVKILTTAKSTNSRCLRQALLSEFTEERMRPPGEINIIIKAIKCSVNSVFQNSVFSVVRVVWQEAE